MHTTDIEVGFILAKDDAFMAAVEDLESLDYEVFQRASRIVQLRMYSAVAEHSRTCQACAVHIVGQRAGELPSHCEDHSEMFVAVDGMLTSEDAPEFKGTLPTTTPTTPSANYALAPVGYEELVKEMYS